MGSFEFLRRAGVTNAESESYGAIAMGQRIAIVPYCYNKKCTGKSSDTCVRKEVRGRPVQCPDCGWALYWTKMKISYESTSALGGY